MFAGGSIILKDPPHPNAARLWLDYEVSQEGSDIQGAGVFRTHPGIKTKFAAEIAQPSELLVAFPPDQQIPLTNTVKDIWKELTGR